MASLLNTVAVGAVLLLAGCARNSDPAADTPSARTGGSAADLQAEVTRLEARLRGLASATGCDMAAQCQTVPVGQRACGGPREYLVYCPVSTDEAALRAVADSLEQAERRHNEATGAVSTCEMRLPPNLEIAAGACRAATP